MSGGIRTLLALVAILAAAVVASPSGARTHESRTLAARDDLESGVLAEINALRRKHSLVPLRLNVRLRAAADTHSAAMANRGFFSHDSADGTIFWKRVARFYPQGSHGYWSVGENLLWSSPDVAPRTRCACGSAARRTARTSSPLVGGRSVSLRFTSPRDPACSTTRPSPCYRRLRRQTLAAPHGYAFHERP